MSTKKQEWLAFAAGKPPSASIVGWHPKEFYWDLDSLHTRLKELKRLKLVLGHRPESISASHPEFLFDQLPLPVLSGDKHVLEEFGRYFDGFELAVVPTGFDGRGKFLKFGNSVLPVPTPQVMYTAASEVPKTRHFAVIDGHFCVTKDLVAKNEYYFKCIEFLPLSKVTARPRAKSNDYSNLFAPRPKLTLDKVQAQFNDWLDKALSKKIPSSVIAFCFNLMEPWSIELVGSDQYSNDDRDWPCRETFRPKVEPLALPESAVGNTWKKVLKSVNSFLEAYLDRPSVGSKLLRRAKAVAVGFVDGDLQTVWPRS